LRFSPLGCAYGLWPFFTGMSERARGTVGAQIPTADVWRLIETLSLSLSSSLRHWQPPQARLPFLLGDTRPHTGTAPHHDAHSLLGVAVATEKRNGPPGPRLGGSFRFLCLRGRPFSDLAYCILQHRYYIVRHNQPVIATTLISSCTAHRIRTFEHLCKAPVFFLLLKMVSTVRLVVTGAKLDSHPFGIIANWDTRNIAPGPTRLLGTDESVSAICAAFLFLVRNRKRVTCVLSYRRYGQLIFITMQKKKIDRSHSGGSLRTTRSVHCHRDHGLQFLLLLAPDGDPCRYLTAVQRLVANPDRCGTRDKNEKSASLETRSGNAVSGQRNSVRSAQCSA